MFPRIFQGDEAVTVVRLSRRAQRLVADRIITGAARAVIVRRAAAAADRAAAVEIEAKLDASRPETLGPIERLTRLEIVPLDADSLFLEVPVELLPAVTHVRPRRLPRELALHRRHFRMHTGECKTASPAI